MFASNKCTPYKLEVPCVVDDQAVPLNVIMVPDPPTIIPLDVPANDIANKLSETAEFDTVLQEDPVYFNNRPAKPAAKAVVASTAQTENKEVPLLFVAAAHFVPSYLRILPLFPTAQPLLIPLKDIALISLDNPLVTVDQVVPVLLNNTPPAPIAQFDVLEVAATPYKFAEVAFGVTTVHAAGGVLIVNLTAVAILVQPFTRAVA